MAIINLRDYYPFYTSDCFMEVSEEVADTLTVRSDPETLLQRFVFAQR